MKPILFLFFAGLLSLNAMAANQITFTHYAWIQQTPSMELYIDAKGKIFANGKILSTKSLEKKLIELKKNNGMVKYAKGKSETKISKKRLEVMKLFRKHQIRVEVYTDKTFSQTIRL